MSDSTPSATPMFPLGAVLVPGAVMPLHVFEPRYREMIQVCRDEQREFGVVMIARGHEVGGGDVRTDVGCLARIESIQETPDGRYGILCVGTSRIKVAEWLADDPYPRAMVERWPDEAAEEASDLTERAEALRVMLRSTLALGAEAGLQLAPATLDLSDDPELLSFQAAAASPVGPFDMYKALSEPSTAGRIELLIGAVAGAREMIEASLAAASDDQDGESGLS